MRGIDAKSRLVALPDIEDRANFTSPVTALIRTYADWVEIPR